MHVVNVGDVTVTQAAAQYLGSLLLSPCRNRQAALICLRGHPAHGHLVVASIHQMSMLHPPKHNNSLHGLWSAIYDSDTTSTTARIMGLTTIAEKADTASQHLPSGGG